MSKSEIDSCGNKVYQMNALQKDNELYQAVIDARIAEGIAWRKKEYARLSHAWNYDALVKAWEQAKQTTMVATAEWNRHAPMVRLITEGNIK